MKLLRLAAASLLVLAILASARPIKAETTTQEMVSACRSIASTPLSNGQLHLNPDFDTGHCWGAFEAINEMIGFTDDKTGKPLFFPCEPAHHRAGQLISIFVQYADKHPAKLASGYFDVALDAIGEAFSCKNTP